MDDLLGLDWSTPTTAPGPTVSTSTSGSTVGKLAQPKPTAMSRTILNPMSSGGSGSAVLVQSPGQGLSSGQRPAAVPIRQPLGRLAGGMESNPTLGRRPKGAPAPDKFADLLSFGVAGSGGTGSGAGAGSSGTPLSLHDRQRLLEEERKQQQKQADDAFAAIGHGLFDEPAAGSQAPSAASKNSVKSAAIPLDGKRTNNPFSIRNSGRMADSSASAAMAKSDWTGDSRQSEDIDDILAAFDSAAPVDASSYLPAPAVAPTASQVMFDFNSLALADNSIDDTRGRKSRRPPAATASKTGQPSIGHGRGNDDDDVISFPQFDSIAVSRSANTSPDGFVHVVPPAAPVEFGSDGTVGGGDRTAVTAATTTGPDEWISTPRSDQPTDRAIAELVDMGFDSAVAAAALSQTDSGHDVTGAVAIILNQVERETARQGVDPSRTQADWADSTPTMMSDSSAADQAWPFTSQKPAGQIASELGTTFIKSANSLWKVGQKHIRQAVAELQAQPQSQSQPQAQSQSSNVHAQQPRWLAEAPSHSRPRSHRPEKSGQPAQLTEEALMMSVRSQEQPKPRRGSRSGPKPALGSRSRPSTSASTESKKMGRSCSRPDRLAPADETPMRVSPARRRPPTQPTDGDLLGSTPDAPAASTPAAAVSRQAAVPKRTIPAMSADRLAESVLKRQAGNDAFKSGDFATAHQLFGAALDTIPDGHPVSIVVLCNRAAAGLKIGDAKGTIADADAALAIVGPAGGRAETIDTGEGPAKEMRDYYGRALHRKAQGLEQLERWADAAEVWRVTVEAGVGGTIGMAGRTRCVRAAEGQGSHDAESRSGSRARPPPATTARPIPRAGSKPTLGSVSQAADVIAAGEAASAAAVQRQRDLDQKTAETENAKFELRDSVDDRITKWAGGPGGSSNIRALLATLDQVLWAGSGWKPIGMAGLVLPQKAKIAYMKALTVVHPDKLPPTATIEQEMLAASIFTILNSAWDKFKSENNM